MSEQHHRICGKRKNDEIHLKCTITDLCRRRASVRSFEANNQEMMHAARLRVMFDRFVFVGHADRENASLRIHFLALRDALKDAGVDVVVAGNALASIAVDGRTCLITYYGDIELFREIRRNGMAERCGLVVCFGSDIRKLSQYLTLVDVVDVFAMPSQHHADVLGLQCSVPVRVVREIVDPLAGDGCSVSPGRRAVWFGYPESYYRGMRAFEKTVLSALQQGNLERFALITNGASIDPRAHQFETLPFSVDSFAAALRGFTYALLSHTPGDLHLNSLIKSPNKVITAIKAGLVPIASATPNYSSVMEELGLQKYLFASPMHLGRLLGRLEPQQDLAFIDQQACRVRVNQIYSRERMLDDFAELLSDVAASRDEIRRFASSSSLDGVTDEGFAGLRDSIQEVGGSMRRIASKAVRRTVARFKSLSR
jgi:hypothetical protein